MPFWGQSSNKGPQKYGAFSIQEAGLRRWRRPASFINSLFTVRYGELWLRFYRKVVTGEDNLHLPFYRVRS